MKIKIAFDLDGVLVDFMAPFKQLLFEIFQIELKDDDPKFNSFDLIKPTGLSRDSICHLFNIVYQNWAPVFPGATELLTKLYEKTLEPPLILTARPFSSATDTYKAVEKMMGKIPFSLVIKHPISHKHQYLYGYDYFVEDRRQTAKELCALGYKVPLVKTSYNKIEDMSTYKNIFYISGVHKLINRINLFVE